MRRLWFLLLLFSCTTEQGTEVYKEDGVAINGYDPVAYFMAGEPVPGTDQHTFVWKNATWKFSSEENLNLFKSGPEEFAPVFGGFCAFGMSNGEGYKATTNPEAWTIVDGKLYLNYSLKVKEKWLESQEERINKAWENWPRVKNDTEVKR